MSGRQGRGRLQKKMARTIAAAVVISLVASMGVFVGYRYSTTRDALEDTAMSYSHLVIGPLSQIALMSINGRMTPQAREQVNRMLLLNPDVERLEILQFDGSLLLSASENQISARRTGDAPLDHDNGNLMDAIRNQAAADARRVRREGKTVFRVVIPGPGEEQVYSTSLVGTFSYGRANSQLRRGILYVALIFALGLILTERVAMLLAREITRNIDRLQNGVRKIRSGRLDERVEISSGDEIEELAGAFNEMTDNLQQTISRLQRANRELYALDQVKIDLVANVSHELRTPLTALKGFLELLDEGELGSLNSEAHRAVTVCRRNVDRLNLRVEDLVALSQMEKSWPEQPPSEPFDMTRLITTVAEIYEVRFRDKVLDLSMDVADDLPMVEGNEEQIERVVINLMDNAVKFTPEGGLVQVKVEECDHDGRRGVLVRVSDSGIGIPQDELVRIFDRFHQVDPSIRRRFGGMGLGLSLVHHIVENHRGVVWAECEDGGGASFLVWLPRWLENESGGNTKQV